MSVNVSLFAGAGWQFFDANGVMLSGGLVYSYVAGTSTPQATYTTSAGNVAHANPIVLDASGRVPSGGEVWATDLAGYKFVLKTAAAVTIGTYDNLTTGVDASTLMYLPSGTGAVSRTVTSKLEEWVSVQDFGAVADGVTDSTAAFTASLLAAGGQYVFVPSGSYYISGVVTGTFFSFGSVTITNGTVTSITNVPQVLVAPVPASQITGTLPVTNGGTGVINWTAGGIVTGNGASALVYSSAGTVGQVLLSGGAGVPTWGTGSRQTGPTSCGAGSTRSHEGVFASGIMNLSGIHFYTDFTLDSGHTITVPAGTRRVIIMASGTITINGIISAVGAGGSGGAADEGVGGAGTDQPANDVSTSIYGYSVDASAVTGSSVMLISDPLAAFGSCGGKGGSNAGDPGEHGGSGGAGGGSIVLIAPTVVLGVTCTLNTSGNPGNPGTGGPALPGKQGSGGNIYIVTNAYTNSGSTFTQTGYFANGVKQINVY